MLFSFLSYLLQPKSTLSVEQRKMTHTQYRTTTKNEKMFCIDNKNTVRHLSIRSKMITFKIKEKLSQQENLII